jgi:hypothetical protein
MKLQQIHAWLGDQVSPSFHCTFPHPRGINTLRTKAFMKEGKNIWRAFWDWFVLFSGVSTASNLSRTRPDPVQKRGFFLFRSARKRL